LFALIKSLFAGPSGRAGRRLFADAAWDRCRYHRALSEAMADVEHACMTLEDIRQDAGVFYGEQTEAWRESPQGRRYEAALRALAAYAAGLSNQDVPDVSVLR